MSRARRSRTAAAFAAALGAANILAIANMSGSPACAGGTFQILWADSRDGIDRLHTATVTAAGTPDVPATDALTKEKK